MEHDFISEDPFVYRNYMDDTSECRGLMDYVDDGVGWSKCSAADFSRFLTLGETRKAKTCFNGIFAP